MCLSYVNFSSLQPEQYCYMTIKRHDNVQCAVFILVLQKIQVFWDIMLCHLVKWK